LSKWNILLFNIKFLGAKHSCITVTKNNIKFIVRNPNLNFNT